MKIFCVYNVGLRIRIRLFFTLMRIQIQLLKIMRIHANSNPQTWYNGAILPIE
jgi:hypothetical protein